MFNIFGDFDSAKDINQAAEGLRTEGDLNNILVLAKENGIDEGMAKAYATCALEELVDPMMAAIGKLMVEKEENKDFKLPADEIVDYLISRCEMEAFATAVRRKNKSLKKCLERTYTEIYKELEKRLTEKGIKKSGMVACNMPDDLVFQIAETYYLG